MAESKDNLVGAYSATAPSFNPSSYTTYEDLLNIVKEIIFTADKGGGVMGSLSNSDPAEAWYSLESNVNAATKRLGEVNEKFAAEIKNMRDHLKGEAGEAFDTYATDMLRESETVWQTLEDKKFGVTIGNVGHVIQATSAAWWEAVYQNAKDLKSQQDLLRDKGVKTLEDLSDNYYDAEIQSLINKVVEATNTAVKNASAEAKEKLVSRLQELLTSLGNQYSDRGRELSPIQIVNGELKSNDERFNSGGGGNGNGDNNDNDDEDDEDEDESGGGSGSGSGSGGGEDYDEGVDDAQDAANEALDQLIEEETDPEKKEALEDAKEAVNEALDGLEGGGEGNGDGSGSGTGSGSSSGGGGDSGLPETSSGGPSGAGGGSPGGSGSGSGDSARQQALEDAQNAANDAIEGLMSPGGGEEAGAGAGGGGVPGGGMSPGGGSSGSGGSSPEAAKRAKALEDAKKAANDAIEGLTGGGGSGTGGGPGSGVPGGDEYSPEQQKAIDDAKAAAGKAIDDLAAGTDDPARKDALEDAKKAAQDAIGELGEAGGGGGQPPTSSNGPGGSGEPLDPETAKALQDAKETTGKAIDDMIAATDDPQQKQALLDAKEAAEDAIDNLIDPEHQAAVADAKDAAGDAIDKLGREGDSAADKQALQDARNAAREAIDGLDGTLDPNDPGYQKSVDDAKSKVDEAIDKLAKPGDSPERTAALEQAKEAAHKAIDGIAKSDAAAPGLAKKSSLDDFLSPSGGGGSGGGSAGGGGGGGLDIPEFGGPGGSDPNSPAQFDVASERGLSPVGQQLATAAVAATPGVPAGAMSQGMPMGGGGMPMGGMGGMGGAGGRQDNAREPQIWMQADPGAWGEDGESEPKPVLGRE
jgi:hypothetical protein